jgi:hypothetical protein
MVPLYTAAAIALAALGVSVSAARSDQYPTLNTAQVCHGITEQSDLEAGLFQTSFDQCMKEEQAVRDIGVYSLIVTSYVPIIRSGRPRLLTRQTVRGPK